MSTTIEVQGREDDLTGVANSATQGTVGATEIRDRPILRSGEVLETVPGVIITQHAGGGKANQYFLLGFNLDHGTDFAIFIDNMPLNLPSHAHASELQQSGDTGDTVASQQSSNRYGVEWANYFTPMNHMAFDFDLANSKALFTIIDDGGAAPDSPGGKRVSEAVGLVISSGATLHNYKGFTSSLRLRYFGPRDLTPDGIYRSPATAMLNVEVGYRFGEKWRASAEFLNLPSRRAHDIDYAYTSKVTPTATAAFTDVFHPVEPFQVRFALVRTL